MAAESTTFRATCLRPALTYAGLVVVVRVTMLLVTDGVAISWSRAGAQLLLMATGVLIVVVSSAALLRVQVSPLGFGCGMLFRQPTAIGWDAVRGAKRIRWLGMPYLKVELANRRMPVWIPLFLRDTAGFLAAVRGFVGEDHPMARAV